MEPEDRHPRPSGARRIRRVVAWAASVVLCPVLPGFVSGIWLSFPVCFVPYLIGLLHAAILGLPLALLAIGLGKPGRAEAAAAGMVIGAVPVPLGLWLSSSGGYGVPLVMVVFGLMGALGGWAFWELLSLTGGLPKKGASAENSV